MLLISSRLCVPLLCFSLLASIHPSSAEDHEKEYFKKVHEQQREAQKREEEHQREHRKRLEERAREERKRLQEREKKQLEWLRKKHKRKSPGNHNRSPIAAHAFSQNLFTEEDIDTRWKARARESRPESAKPPYDSISAPDSIAPRRQHARNRRPIENQRPPQNIQMGKRVEGTETLMVSPFAPDAGYIDIQGLSSGTEIVCPFTEQPLLVP